MGFHGPGAVRSQMYLTVVEVIKTACYCNPCHTLEAYVNHHRLLSLVQVVMWLSLPEPVRMNRMTGGGIVTSSGRCDGVGSWGLWLWTLSDEEHSEINCECHIMWEMYIVTGTATD